MLSGDGATGKIVLVLQGAAAVATGGDGSASSSNQGALYT